MTVVPTESPKGGGLRRMQTAAIVALILVVGMICVVVALQMRPKAFFLPFTINDVASVKVSDYAGVGAQFEVPLSHCKTVLDALAPANVDPHPDKWEVFGYLHVKLKDGSPYQVMFSGRGEFKAGGVYYRGEASDRLRRTVQNAYEASKPNAPPRVTK